MSWRCYRSLTLPHRSIGWSVVCDGVFFSSQNHLHFKDSSYKCVKEVNTQHSSPYPRKFKSSVFSAHLTVKTQKVGKYPLCSEQNVHVSLGKIMLMLMSTAKTEHKG